MTALTGALELPRPHALPRGGALGAVGCLAAGLGAVAGEEDLALVDATVVLRGAAHRAVDAGALGAVGAPLAQQHRLGRRTEPLTSYSVHAQVTAKYKGST